MSHRPLRDMTPLEVAQRTLGYTTGEAQVSVDHERSLMSRFARSVPTQATRVDDVTVSVLCVRDGHTALTVTNAVDDEGLADVARRAGEVLDAITAVAREPGDFPGLPEPAPARGHAGYDGATARLDPERPGRALAEAFDAAAARGLQAFGVWTAGETRTAIASTRGLEATDAVTDAYMKVVCRHPSGRSGFASATAVRSDELDAGALAQAAAGLVGDRDPAPVVPDEHPVVLGADAVATLLDFLGALAFNGLAHAEGRGALTDRLGQAVAPPTVNLSDTPRFPGALARAFDAEGVPKAPLPLIQDGVAHAVVHDTRSAARAGAGARSTGHALSPGGDDEGPHPTNLVLAGGGAADVHELALPIERGLYITRLWYVNAVHEQQTLLTGMSRDGTFLIEDGRITRPACDVRFTDSVLRILSATEDLGRHVRPISEGEFYGRRFATGTICPPLRAHGFRVTGTSP